MTDTTGDIGLINLGGRPRKYSSPEEFDEMVGRYYNHCISTGEPITWTGLALYLGFSSRQAIDEYQHYDGFYDSVKRAKTLVEYGYEKLLHKGQNAAAPIFALKNFGWSDKGERDQQEESKPDPVEITVNPAKNEVTVTHGKPRD